MENNELYHYGVLGMKWGHRKAKWEAIRNAKKAYKQRNAGIQNRYFKTMENIERGYKRGQNISKKDEIKELRADTLATNSWKKSKAQYKSDIAKAKSDYRKNVTRDKEARKQQKQANKEAIKRTYESINKSSSLGEKMIFSSGTRKAAAKYVVNNNMSIKDAKKKANKRAIENTVAILGAIGAYHIANKMVKS